MRNLLFALAVASALGAFAQTDSLNQSMDTVIVQITDFDREQAILANMMEELSLSDAQIPQVAALLSERTSQIAEVRANANTDEAKREQIKQINLVIRMQLKDILTDEQLDIYISIRRNTLAQRAAAGIVRDQINHLVEDF